MKRTIAMLLAISFVACNMNYEKTASGLAYKIFPGKGGEKPKPGNFIKFNFEYLLKDRDSVFQTTYGALPAYTTLDSGKRVEYSYMEIMPLMSVGDSAVVSISIDTLKNRGLIPEYSPIFVKGQVLIAKVKLLQVFKDEKLVVDDYNKTIEGQKVAEIKSIEQYLAKKNLKGVKTKNGAYVVIDNPGDQTVKADSGKMAIVLYRGYLQSNGKVFDTNIDTSRGHAGATPFAVGTRSNIQGFNECLPYFGKGGKGKFLIPSMLAYGPQAQGPDIPAFSNLVFDIEVTDVQDMPAQQQNPMMQRPQGDE